MFKHASLQSVRRVLCLGAHSDDIEIGCGGTLLRLARENPALAVRWVVFSGADRREQEARASAARFLEHAGQKEIIVQHFRDGFFPYAGADVKEYFEAMKRDLGRDFVPDLIFTHYRDDLHQDHALLNRLTGNTFRDHWILEYEIPKYDGDLGRPNTFVHLDEATVARKVQLLREGFPSQADKPWFTEETFRATLRLRGVESNAPGKYAEGFYCRKWAL